MYAPHFVLVLVFGGRVLGPAGGGVSSDLLLYVPPEEGPREVTLILPPTLTLILAPTLTLILPPTLT